MKFLNACLFLLVTSSAFAAKSTVEFDPQVEMRCADESSKLGCKGSDVQITNCKESKKSEMSQECRTLHEAQFRN